MFGQYLENLLRNANPAGVTESFVAIIVALFLVSAVLSKTGTDSRLVANTPNLLTSIGILGTFTGIVIGLMGFDSGAIDDSIDTLLEGLKTAFITSLAGMGSSIAFKILSATPLLMHRERAATGNDVGPALLAAMQSQGKRLEALRQAIAGDEESSLAGQIKLFRSDTRDRYDEEKNYMAHSLVAFNKLTKHAESQREVFDAFTIELWKRLADFAEMMSKSATEQVINALKEVIADFNRKLTEQFGENFKALDAAVQRLVEWQENYRVQLGQMGEQYQQGVAAITQTEASVAHISEKSKQIPQTMEFLKAVLEVNQHQIEELGRHLQAFKEVKDKAVQAVPELQRQVDATVTSITNATQQLATGISESTDKAKTAIITGAEEFDANVHRLNANLTSTSDILATQTDKIREQLGDTVIDLNSHAREMVQTLVDGSKSMTKESANMKDILQAAGKQVQADAEAIQEEVADSIGQMQKRLEGALQEVFQAQTREIDKVFVGIDHAVTEVAKRTGENVNSQLELIDRTMTQEVERVMTEMGRALAAITGRFTNDYESLVNSMQAIVRQRGNGA